MTLQSKSVNNPTYNLGCCNYTLSFGKSSSVHQLTGEKALNFNGPSQYYEYLANRLKTNDEFAPRPLSGIKNGESMMLVSNIELSLMRKFSDVHVQIKKIEMRSVSINGSPSKVCDVHVFQQGPNGVTQAQLTAWNILADFLYEHINGKGSIRFFNIVN